MDSLPLELAVASRPRLGRSDLAGLAVVLALGGTLSWLSLCPRANRRPGRRGTSLGSSSWRRPRGLWWHARGVARASPQTRPSLWRQASFLLGVAAIYAVV